MLNSNALPPTNWPTLIQRAPGFSSVLMDVLCDEGPTQFAPHIRAVYYYDLFDAQVSNGGVDQYFSNLALSVSDFSRIPEFVAQNPVFDRALPLLREVHAIWDEIASAYRAACDQDEDGDSDASDDCEALLAPYVDRFAAIGKAFYALHHAVRQGLEADIVRMPHHYFSIESVPGLRGTGVEHTVLDGGTSRLRFEDGFPVGPNILEREDGHCDVIQFSRDRQLLHAQTTGFLGNPIHHWVHYPSQASGRWSFNFSGDGRSVREGLRSLWQAHGLCEYFHENGQLESASVHWHGEELCSESFYPDGTMQLRIRRRDDGGQHWLRYWPNGALNTERVDDKEGRSHYLRCLDAEGNDLAPHGTGRLYEFLSLDDGMHQWHEGELLDGYLSGWVLRMASLPDGSKARETERRFFEAAPTGKPTLVNPLRELGLSPEKIARIGHAVQQGDGRELLHELLLRGLWDNVVDESQPQPQWMEQWQTLGATGFPIINAQALDRLVQAGVDPHDLTDVVRSAQILTIYNVAQLLDHPTQALGWDNPEPTASVDLRCTMGDAGAGAQQPHHRLHALHPELLGRDPSGRQGEARTLEWRQFDALTADVQAQIRLLVRDQKMSQAAALWKKQVGGELRECLDTMQRLAGQWRLSNGASGT